MLSFGIEFSRAFSIAFWRAMLPPGSGPPSRAATMIARVSFEKSCPRFASVAPFFRLIDAHLLCPDKARLPDCVEEELVDARVVGELGVEGSDQEAALPEEDRLAVELGQDFDVGAGRFDLRGADEHASERLVLSGQMEVGFEAEDLAAVRVAGDLDVDEAKVLAVEDDQAGAGAEDGLLKVADRVLEPVEPHQAHERRRLAARDDEAVEPLELLRLAHLDCVRAEPAEHRRVLTEVSLEGENADLHGANSRFRPVAGRNGRKASIRRPNPGCRTPGVVKRNVCRVCDSCLRGAAARDYAACGCYQPRVSSSSSGGMPAAARPVIASPRPCETRASTSASR